MLRLTEIKRYIKHQKLLIPTKTKALWSVHLSNLYTKMDFSVVK
jgi:hypothetical protein